MCVPHLCFAVSFFCLAVGHAFKSWYTVEWRKSHFYRLLLLVKPRMVGFAPFLSCFFSPFSLRI